MVSSYRVNTIDGHDSNPNWDFFGIAIYHFYSKNPAENPTVRCSVSQRMTASDHKEVMRVFVTVTIVNILGVFRFINMFSEPIGLMVNKGNIFINNVS